MQELLRRLLDFTGDGVYRYTFDDGILLSANQGFVNILDLNCAPDDLIGRPLRELLIYTEKEGTVRKALAERGEIHSFLYHFKTLKGQDKWVVHDSLVTTDPDSGARVVEAIVKDVTSRMQAEEALAHEHNLLRTLIDHLPDCIYFKDVESRFIVANNAVASLMGVSREELLGKTDFDFYPKNLAEQFFADEREVVQTGQPLIGREELVVDAAGESRWFSTTKVPIRDLQGNVIGIVGIGRDITKHRQVEEALLEALQRFEAVIDNTPLVAIQGFDQDGYIRHWNRACTALYGFAAEDALGKRLQDILLAGDEAAEFERTLRRVWFTGKATTPQEWRVRTRTGEERWVYSTIFPILEHGKVSELFCMDVDVTERKRAEEALRLDESRLEALLKLDQMAGASLETITHFALEEAIRLAGSTIGYLAFLNDDETVLTMYAWSRTAMEECSIADKPLVYPVVTTGLWGEAVRQRKPIITNDYAAPNPCKKGYPEGHVQVTRHMNVPVFDGDHIVLVAGVGNKPTDYDDSDLRQLTLLMAGMWRIVQRNRAAEALRESEIKFRTVADNTHDWEFWLSPEGKFIYISPSCRDLTGHDAREFEADPQLFLRLVHAEDVPRVAEHVRHEALREQPGRLEFRIVDANGTERWIEHMCHPVYDDAGQFLGSRGSNRDVTDRKLAEQRLARLNACFLQFTPDPAENIQRLTELCGELTGATCALYNRLQDGWLRTEAGWQVPPGFPSVDRPEGHVCHDVIRRGGEDVFAIADLEQTVYAQTDPAVARYGLKSYVGHPVRCGKDTVGSLCLVYRARYSPSEQDKRLLGIIAQAITVEEERKRVQESLRESEDRYHTLFTLFPDGIFLAMLDGRILDCNASACAAFGYTKEELLDRTLGDLVSEEFAANLPHIASELSKGRLFMEAPARRSSGEAFPAEVTAQMLTIGGTPFALVHIRDVADRKRAEEDRKRLEAQIQQAQKLESLGVLAGGIAHDFNNLLTGILGHASLTLMELSPVSPARESVQQIETIARRAAELTKQMLAYSGKGKFVVQPIRLSEVVEEMTHLLDVSISKKCILRYHFAKDLPPIEGDVTQIRQVIMNLIINASEAIGEKSGVIGITTGVMQCDRGYLAETYLDEDLPEGAYVYLEVSDTGSGMTPETQSKLFDPFFTTKFTGRGLGLAAVLGIVRGHHGAIRVYSEVGRGSTFKILFPVAKRDAPAKPAAGPEPETCRGSGTVLVVDDEIIVRELAREVLEDAGFKVLIAEDGHQAIQIFREHVNEIQVVLLDLTMPRMDGEEAFTDMRRIRSDVCVILSSGYNEQDATERFAGKGLAGFIHKPYCAGDLVRIICKAIESRTPKKGVQAPKPKRKPRKK